MMKRRAFISQSLQVSSLVGASLASTSAFALNRSKATPPQTDGPFYPVIDRVDKDLDMTLVKGHSKRAKGQLHYLTIIVRDQEGRPLSGALIDLWQACFSGRYDHPRDPNTDAELDPNFQYFARGVTDSNGELRVLTIKPGAYPATNTWMRPPHIHIKVVSWDLKDLTTQIYFGDELELNNADQILKKTAIDFGQSSADSLIVNFTQKVDQKGNSIAVGHFELILGETPAIND